tara:strand:- start:529 stop:726 length:198 start_codon:yes stop_codon:yes gene_type:complete
MEDNSKTNYQGETVEYIDVTPTWEQTADMLIMSLENSNDEGKKFARKEIQRMGRIIDSLTTQTKS